MAQQPFKKVVTSDRVINQLQGNIELTVSQLLKSPCNDYNVIDGIAFDGVNSRVINHGLQRAIRGWFVVRLQSSVDIHHGASLPVIIEIAESVPTTVTLDVASACTVSVLFW